ncbi:MAG: metallophosphoesterase [Candidatus Omnitrophica bacterium]|nr:metallophosphoesterase [Candidatus Omnitrophota bacterium]
MQRFSGVKIGVMADSHDNLIMVRKVLALFGKEKVNLVLHAGDYIAPFCVKAILKELKCPFHGVLGNNDGESTGLYQASDGKITKAPLKLTFCGKRIVVLHHPDFVEKFLKSKKFDLIIFGHTHQPSVEKKKGVLVVNPGECGGWTTGKASAAIVDMEKLTARLVWLK